MDDVLVLGANRQLLDKLKKQLMDRFEMTNMGDVSRVLGVSITRDRKEMTITINQTTRRTSPTLWDVGLQPCVHARSGT